MKKINLQALGLLMISLVLLSACKKEECIDCKEATIENQQFSVVENAENGTIVDTVVATGTNDADILYFEFLSGNFENAFSIDEASGCITVNNTVAIDYESIPYFDLSVRVTNSMDLSAAAKIRIDVEDVDEGPEIIMEEQQFSVHENTPYGTVVDTVIASCDDILEFEILNGNMENAFRIDEASGSITVNSTAAIDYESMSSFDLLIQVTNSAKISLSAIIRINVEDIKEYPEDGIVAHYKGDGNGNDNGPNGYDLSGYMAYSADRDGNGTSAFFCDGNNGLTLADQSFPNQSEPQSMSLWFRTSSPNSIDYGGTLFGAFGVQTNGGGSRFLLSIKDGIVRATYGDELGDDNKWGEHLNSSETYHDNIWHHVVFISKGDYKLASLFIDGQLLDSRILTKQNNNIVNNIELKLGGDKVQNYFDGEIDDLILYNRALGTEEVLRLFNEG